jgi:hypothetical protein
VAHPLINNRGRASIIAFPGWSMGKMENDIIYWDELKERLLIYSF